MAVKERGGNCFLVAVTILDGHRVVLLFIEVHRCVSVCQPYKHRHKQNRPFEPFLVQKTAIYPFVGLLNTRSLNLIQKDPKHCIAGLIIIIMNKNQFLSLQLKVESLSILVGLKTTKLVPCG